MTNNDSKMRCTGAPAGLLLVFGGVLAGCQVNTTPTLITATATTIGVELGANAGSATPSGVLGYRRAEMAIVPTNRGHGKVGDTEALGVHGNGARDTANVLMELRHDGIFSSGAGIYQRLAVGDIAVQQDGATILFSKNQEGEVSADAQSLRKVAVQNLDVEKGKVEAIAGHVDDGSGKVDKTKMKALVDKAKTENPAVMTDSVVSSLLKLETTQALRDELVDLSAPVIPLFNAIGK